MLMEDKYYFIEGLRLKKEEIKLYGYKSIEKESLERICKMVEFLNEIGVNIETDSKEVLKLKLIEKLNNMDLERLSELKIFIDKEIVRCKNAGIHIHRYKYKLNLYKLVSKILNEKTKNI